jgi:chromosome segregation ATPase
LLLKERFVDILFPPDGFFGLFYLFCACTVNLLQAESTRARNDIEARNTVLNAELAKVQKQCEDATRKLSSIQSLSDVQTQSIELLERDQEANKRVIAEYEQKMKELVRQ